MPKFWYQCKAQSWTQVKESYQKFLALEETIGVFKDEDINNIWYVLNYIMTEIDTREPKQSISDWHTEKACISLLETNVVEDILNIINDIEVKGNTISKNVAENIVMFPEHGFLTTVGINEEVIHGWEIANSQMLNLQISLKVTQLSVLFQNILEQARLIMISIGLPFVMDLYTLEELKEILLGSKKEYEFNRLIFTLREAVYDEEESHDTIKVLMDYLMSGSSLFWREMEWKEVLKMTLILDIVYRRFFKLHEIYQEVLLKAFFYRAIVLGIPVRSVIQTDLKLTGNIVSYLLHTKNFVEYIDKNLEPVPVVGNGQDVKRSLSQTIQPLKELTDEQKVGEILRIYENHPAKDVYSIWLTEATQIYFLLTEGKLINWFKDREMSDFDKFQDDMIRLVASFGFGGQYIDILNYYQQSNPFVKLQQFISALAQTVNLGEQKNIENVINFTNFLHTNNFIAQDQELIVFDENEGKFKWVEQGTTVLNLGDQINLDQPTPQT